MPEMTEWTSGVYVNCAECEMIIEPGDRAGRIRWFHDGATICEDCLDWNEGWEPSPRSE